MSGMADKVFESLVKDCRRKIKDEYKQEKVELQATVREQEKIIVDQQKEIKRLARELSEALKVVDTIHSHAIEWEDFVREFESYVNRIMKLRLSEVHSAFAEEFQNVTRWHDGAKGILKITSQLDKAKKRNQHKRR